MDFYTNLNLFHSPHCFVAHSLRNIVINENLNAELSDVMNIKGKKIVFLPIS